MKALSEFIKAWRTERGLSMRALATAAGVSVTYISKLESGQDVNPTVDMIHRLATALRVPEDVLYRAAVGAIDAPPYIPAAVYDAAPRLTWEDWQVLTPMVQRLAQKRAK